MTEAEVSPTNMLLRRVSWSGKENALRGIGQITPVTSGSLARLRPAGSGQVLQITLIARAIAADLGGLELGTRGSGMPPILGSINLGSILLSLKGMCVVMPIGTTIRTTDLPLCPGAHSSPAAADNAGKNLTPRDALGCPS